MREKTSLRLSKDRKSFQEKKVQRCLILFIWKSGYNLLHWIIRSYHYDISYPIHDTNIILCQLLPDQSKKFRLIVSEVIFQEVWFSPFITFSHRVQSPCVSKRWMQKLWCRHQGTVVFGRHDPRTWPRKPPNPLLSAHTPMDLRCHRGNCRHAYLTGCFQRKAYGMWRHYGSAAGNGDGGECRVELAVESLSMSGLRDTEKLKFKMSGFAGCARGSVLSVKVKEKKLILEGIAMVQVADVSKLLYLSFAF